MLGEQRADVVGDVDGNELVEAAEHHDLTDGRAGDAVGRAGDGVVEGDRAGADALDGDVDEGGVPVAQRGLVVASMCTEGMPMPRTMMSWGYPPGSAAKRASRASWQKSR